VPFLGALENGFAFDDHALIVDFHPTLRERLTDDFFGRDDQGHPASGYWRPVTDATYALEHALYGDDPRGYHAHNLALHGANSGLFFLLLSGIPALAPFALPAAAIFAAHPVHAESVAPITGRTDPLGFFFVLLAAHALARGRRTLAGAAFLLALGAKESSLALLPLLAAIPLVRGATRREVILTVSGGLAIAALFFAVKIGVLGIVPPSGVYTGEGSLGQRALTFVALLPKYLGLLVWPAELTIAHEAPLVTSLSDPRLLTGLAALIAFSGAIASTSRALAVGALLLVLPLLPASNLIPITYSYRWMPFPFFERYLYAATGGFALLVAIVASHAATRWMGAARAPRIATLAGCAIACLLGLRLMARVPDFESDRTLFQAATRLGLAELAPRIQAASARFLSGDPVGALGDFDVLLAEPRQREAPDPTLLIERATVQCALAQIYRNHATAAQEKNDSVIAGQLLAAADTLAADAVPRLEALRKTAPTAMRGRVFELLATFTALEGDWFASARLFREATLGEGTTSELARNFGLVCDRLRAAAREIVAAGRTRTGDAISLYQRALEAICGSYPPSAVPEVVREQALVMWCDLADQHVLVGESERASAAYVAILALDPERARCHEGIGHLCKQGGNREAAYQRFQTALRIQPESWYALNEMFTMLREDGRFEEAQEYLTRMQRYIEKYGKPGSSLTPPPDPAK
jgi:protein O-mannosyl-transferase